MPSIYQETQRSYQTKLIHSKDSVFYQAKSGKYFMKDYRDFVLYDGSLNLFEPIREITLKYFSKNNISWWGGRKPTGHVLSSQIACLNHLFQIREDKEAVLALIKTVSSEFVDVIKIETDQYFPGYIQFEAVSDKDHLNEGATTRGNNCTSIDALIYAKHIDGSKWLIPIEWKYTEFYNTLNKATEGIKKNSEKYKGKERQDRYNNLIRQSEQLKEKSLQCYYYEPFYQLMRQTLWAEQMITHKNIETLKPDNYMHLHIIPTRNLDLLKKKYPCSGMDMESTWRNHLAAQNKYLIISPEVFLKPVIEMKKYQPLTAFIKKRYWM